GPRVCARDEGPSPRTARSESVNNGLDGAADVTLDLFAPCAKSSDGDRETYVRRVADVARWSERFGCKGILVYSDNRLVDPWLVSHVIIQSTTRLCPLVAVQPIYMHPYAVAKMAASFGHLYGRRIYLNMVAGGFKNDLVALNDPTPHDKRYDRLIEYTLIIRELLNGASALSYDGEAWQTAHERFPEDRKGQLTHQLAMKVSDSAWHKQLSDLAAATASGESPYWLVPFQNYKTMCPYLVGSYERVGEELARYIGLGYRSFILDIPPTEEELHHASQAFQRAVDLVTR